jgi:hypothetical protein
MRLATDFTSTVRGGGALSAECRPGRSCGELPWIEKTLLLGRRDMQGLPSRDAISGLSARAAAPGGSLGSSLSTLVDASPAGRFMTEIRVYSHRRPKVFRMCWSPRQPREPLSPAGTLCPTSGSSRGLRRQLVRTSIDPPRQPALKEARHLRDPSSPVAEVPQIFDAEDRMVVDEVTYG